MVYFSLNTIGKLLAKLGVSTCERIARVLTVVFFDVLRIRRRTILSNLETAFGSEKPQVERLRIGRESVYSFFCGILEFLRSVNLDISRDIKVKGEENIQNALADGKGVYVLCFHLGNWEAMGAKFTKDLCPAHVLVKAVGHGDVDRFVSDRRDGNRFLTVKRRQKGDGFRAIKEILAQNEAVGFVIDQARPGEPRLDFFGAPAKTNTSFAAIWQRYPAPIVPAFILRSRLDSHTLHVLPQLKMEPAETKAESVLAHSLQFNKVVEQAVRTCPEQYFWMHRRWK